MIFIIGIFSIINSIFIHLIVSLLNIKFVFMYFYFFGLLKYFFDINKKTVSSHVVNTKAQ